MKGSWLQLLAMHGKNHSNGHRGPSLKSVFSKNPKDKSEWRIHAMPVTYKYTQKAFVGFCSRSGCFND